MMSIVKKIEKKLGQSLLKKSSVFFKKCLDKIQCLLQTSASKKSFLCKVDSISNAVITDDYEKVFTGTLSQAFSFAKEQKVQLEILFDYECGYLFVKNLPSLCENRQNWEEYQKKDLFNEQELSHCYKYQKRSVWLNLGAIASLIKEQGKWIKNLAWAGDVLFEYMKKRLPTHTSDGIVIIDSKTATEISGIDQSVSNDFFLAGMIDGDFVSCRKIDSNHLSREIEETAMYLSQYKQDIDSCSVSVLDNVNTRNTLRENWNVDEGSSIANPAEQIQNKVQLNNWFQFINVDCMSNNNILSQQEISTKSIINSQSVFSKGHNKEILLLAGIVIVSLMNIWAVNKKWDTTNIAAEIQLEQQSKKMLQTEISNLPRSDFFEKLDKLQQDFVDEEERIDGAIKLLYVCGGFIKDLQLKNNEIAVSLQVKKPRSYFGFIKTSEQLNRLITSVFHQAGLVQEGKNVKSFDPAENDQSKTSQAANITKKKHRKKPKIEDALPVENNSAHIQVYKYKISLDG